MKRILIVIIGLIIGASAAAITTVEIRHLRGVGVTSALLPVWSEQLSPNSGLSRGQLVEFSQTAQGGPLSAKWRYGGTTSRGVFYLLDVNGDGVALKTTVLWPFFSRRLVIVNATGEISAKALFGAQTRLALGGSVVIQSAQGQVHLARPRQIDSLSAKGVWRNVSLEGLALGNILLELQPQENGDWSMQLSNPGPPMAVSGTLTGRYDSASAQVDLTVVGADEIDPGLRQQLDRALAPIENGWSIRQAIALPVPQLTLTTGN